MRGVIKLGLGAIVVAVGGFFILTAPAMLDPNFGQGRTPDVKAGQLVFAAGGCASCHAAPEATGEAKLLLTGGLPFPSDFGTFYAPNISTNSEHGIGAWTLAEFARALTKGVSPANEHYYPAFPYTAYTHMVQQDVIDLFAYMQTLPDAATPNRSHEIGFPFNIRRGLGLWKKRFASDGFVLADAATEEIARGRYLSEALAHCGECHTPRNAVGALNYAAWFAGAPNPSGKGTVPNITPAALDWSEADLVEYFTSGFTPDYDSAGGKMAEVVSNLAQLPQSDRAAIAAYLKAIPAIE